VFGEDVSDALKVIRPPLMPLRAIDQLTTTVGNATAIANLGAQSATTLGAFQGLVQLTPATMEALKFATPMTSGGVNLGSLVDASNNIVHSVQWVPAGATGLASGLAAVGPAVAMLAIQVQLAKISSLVSENVRLTDELLRAVRIERWAEVEGLHEAMLKAVDEASHIGEVSDPIWQNVASHEAALDKVRHEFLEKVAAHAAGLRGLSGHSQRREYLVHHGEAILRATQALFRAQAAWFTYQAVRAGHCTSWPTRTRRMRSCSRRWWQMRERVMRGTCERRGSSFDNCTGRRHSWRSCRASALFQSGSRSERPRTWPPLAVDFASS
jgi:hypothetical protein